MNKPSSTLPVKSTLRRGLIIGNPNSGKTTLFNLLTKSKKQVGNWAGVTVSKSSRANHELGVEFVDLPGIYSISQFSNLSADEKETIDTILADDYDFIINVIDSSNVERNLNLTVQLSELQKPMVLILNMADLAKKKRMYTDAEKLGAIFGCQAIQCNIKGKQCLHPLEDIINQTLKKPNADVSYPNEIQEALRHTANTAKFLIALEGCYRPKNLITDNEDKIIELRNQVEKKYHEDIDMLIAASRFEFVSYILSKCYIKTGKIGKNLSYRLDRLFLNKWLGLPIFTLMMYLIFYIIIFVSSGLQDFFELFSTAFFIELPLELVNHYFANNMLAAVVKGLGGGIVTVLTFIPVIGTMYFLLGLLEETGYMTRAAYMMDDYLRKISLPGKAFIPLIVGFGCNVPGIIATKTIDNKQDRITTIMMSPFMSCGARLSLYSLFCVTFFKDDGQNIVFSLYIIGIFFAILTGLLLKKLIFKNVAPHMIMELPNYQIPSFRALFKATKSKLFSFCFGAGKIIVLMFLIINFISSLEFKEEKFIEYVGKSTTFIFEPMGIKQDNWPAVVAIFTGALAKEVVVGTLSAFYTLEVDENPGFKNKLEEAFSIFDDETTTESDNLKSAIRNKFDSLGAVYAYLLFILLYFPCASVFSAIYSEIGAKWAYASAIWSTTLAYSTAVLFYQTIQFFKGQEISPLAILISLILPPILVITFARAENAAIPD